MRVRVKHEKKVLFNTYKYDYVPIYERGNHHIFLALPSRSVRLYASTNTHNAYTENYYYCAREHSTIKRINATIKAHV